MPDDVPKEQTEPSMGGSGGHRPTRVGSDMAPPSRFVCCACHRIVDQASWIFPFMDAYVCIVCQAAGKRNPVSENEITNKAFEPWTKDQVALLKEYQDSKIFLPFICPLGHKLTAQLAGLTCPTCPSFHLRWTYPWVLSGAWKDV